MWNKGLVLRKGWGLSGLGLLTLNKGLKGQNASEMRGLGHYIYIYMPERHWVVHILAVLKVNRLSTVLSKSHFYSREKHFKS